LKLPHLRYTCGKPVEKPHAELSKERDLTNQPTPATLQHLLP
jgi:hypothetical protein